MAHTAFGVSWSLTTAAYPSREDYALTEARVIRVNCMNENESFSQVGGARFDFFNATWPFVKINVSPNTIELKCFSKKYTFSKDQIVDLRECAGMISNGLLIEHKLKNYPHHMVFWSVKFDRLKHGLERLGYVVNIPKKSDTWYKGGP